jgi:hypothetical protein
MWLRYFRRNKYTECSSYNAILTSQFSHALLRGNRSPARYPANQNVSGGELMHLENQAIGELYFVRSVLPQCFMVFWWTKRDLISEKKIFVVFSFWIQTDLLVTLLQIWVTYYKYRWNLKIRIVNLSVFWSTTLSMKVERNALEARKVSRDTS